MARPKKTPPPKAAAADLGGVPLVTLDVFLIGGPVSEAFVEAHPVVSRTIQIRGD